MRRALPLMMLVACNAEPETESAAQPIACAVMSETATLAEVKAASQELVVTTAPSALPGGGIIPASCSCETVTIQCGSIPDYPDAVGVCYREICTLYLSPLACLDYQLVDGQVIDPRLLLGHDHPPSFPRDPTGYCTVKHEARHACDQPIAVSSCESEMNAYLADYACMRNRFTEHCTPFPSPSSAARFAYCESLRQQLVGNLIAADFNTCVCRPDRTCSECKSECEARAGVGELCDILGRNYCDPGHGDGPGLE